MCFIVLFVEEGERLCTSGCGVSSRRIKRGVGLLKSSLFEAVSDCKSDTTKVLFLVAKKCCFLLAFLQEMFYLCKVELNVTSCGNGMSISGI